MTAPSPMSQMLRSEEMVANCRKLPLVLAKTEHTNHREDLRPMADIGDFES